jgi:hypothetical protein
VDGDEQVLAVLNVHPDTVVVVSGCSSGTLAWVGSSE